MATTPGLTRRSFLKTGMIGSGRHQPPQRLCAGRSRDEAGRAREAGRSGEAGRGAEAGRRRPRPRLRPRRTSSGGRREACRSSPSQPRSPPVRPRGQITIVIEAEPNTIVTKDSTTNNGQIVVDNIYDHLTARDHATGKLVPKLAESWTRVQPTTWRFKLRQDVKFTNGEPFNADAVVVAIEDLNDPQKPGLGATDYGSPQSATKVDEFTVDITTATPDPILPEKLNHFGIPAPNWLKTRQSRSSGDTGGRERTVHPGRVREGPAPALQGQPELLGAEQAEDRRDQDGLPRRAAGPRGDAPGRRG